MKIVDNPKEINGLRVIQDPNEMEQALKNGESFYHWELGDSLSPLIRNAEYCLIKPCLITEIKRGDCVFCIMEDRNGNRYPMVHQVWEISDASYYEELWFKIGSTMSTIFGWTKEVYGIARGTNIFQDMSTLELIETAKVEQNGNT
jgi:recombinational DNA repair protein RecR